MRKFLHIVVYVFAAIGFILVSVYLAVNFGLTKTSGIIDKQHDFFKNATSTDVTWTQNDEWPVLKEAILKDKDVIKKAANDSGISPRIIVSTLIVEQLRLFNDNREVFKAVFAPLKILGNQSQFSWGVMGIKQDTAKEIENNLKDQKSIWYLGARYEHLLDFITSSSSTPIDPDTERFNRLTDEKNRYYSYLYGGLLLNEIETQWQKAGFLIDDKPEILATLFNIGFNNSHPNAFPNAGGAEIDIGTTKYSFGGLAGSFYYSNELIGEFPR